MNVYPNPSNGNFTFTYRMDSSEKLSFEMINAVGQVVWNGTSDAASSGRRVIETAGMAPGVYTLVVSGNSYSTSRRLIITK